MALDPIVLDADPMPALAAKVNANFARLGLAGVGAPALPADFLGQEYLDTETGTVHVARAVGSALPAEDWEPKLRTDDSRLSDARPPLAHEHAIADIVSLQATLNGKQNASQKGQPNGYASLDAGGKVPAAQLPAVSGGTMNYASAIGSPATLVSTTEVQIGAVTITPGSATARILVLARADLSKDGGSTARVATLRVRRGTQNTDPQIGVGSIGRSDAVAGAQFGPLAVLAIDQPNTTTAVTYSVRGVVSAGNSTANRFELVAVELTGAVGPQGPIGPAGVNGNTVRSGGGAPPAGLGAAGDFYLDTSAVALYGPKAAGGWGTPTSLVGPAGPAGTNGAQGPAGVAGPIGPLGPQGPAGRDGRTILGGSGAPAAALGAEGDFYLDRAAGALYGPKTAGGWGTPTSLVGPAGPPGSGGSGGLYAGQRALAGSGEVTGADRARLVRVTGAAVTVALAAAGFAELDWVEIRNDNPGDTADGIVALVAGADGINEADRESVLLAPGDTVRLVKVAAAAPAWLTLSPIGFLALGGNQHAAANDAGTTQEARTDRHAFMVDIVDPAGDGEHGGFRAAWPGRLETVHGRARAGTVALAVLRNGTPLAGFATPMALSTTEAVAMTGDSFTAGDYITYRLTATNGLAADGNGRKGAYVTAVAVRTGD